MSKLLKVLICITAFLTSFIGVKAQAPQFSLIICGPGQEVYELEGHAALRAVLPDGSDMIVNWGLFDFDSPNFIYRFVKGETDYCAGASSAHRFLNSYNRDGRWIKELKLNLSPEQSCELFELINENLKPENRVYRYNYVLDNCATRPMNLIEKVVGDSIQYGESASIPQQTTFRNVMRFYHREYPWYQFGIDLALGSGIDRPISEREKIFAPVLLAEMAPEAIVANNPLVTDVIELSNTQSGNQRSLLSRIFTPITVSVIILLFTIFVSLRDYRRKQLTFWLDRALFSVFGLAGLLLTFLIFISVHEATSPNYLYLWLNPFAFIVVFCISIKRLRSLVLCYQSVNFVAVIALVIIAMSGVQSLNLAVYPLILSDLIRSFLYIFIARCNEKKIN